MIGGLEPARTIMLRLLESGKDVVTANKALLAEHGPELFDRARELGRSIAFEAAVAGGIPIIANISQCLSANQIESLDGILNGTSNFILTKMHEEGTAVRRRGGRGPAAGLRRSRPDARRRRQRRRTEARDPGPLGVRRPGALGRYSADRHRLGRYQSTCDLLSRWATGLSCWRWLSLMRRRSRALRFPDACPTGPPAGRSERCLSTRFEWLATQWGP